MGGGPGGEPSDAILTILKAIPLQSASEQVRGPRRHPRSDRGGPQRDTLTKNLHHSQQIDEFSAQIAILRCDFEPHVTKYCKLLAFIDRDGPSWTRDTYDGGGEGGSRGGDRQRDDRNPLRFELLLSEN